MACDDRPICFCQPDDTEEKWDDEYGRYDGHVIEGELGSTREPAALLTVSTSPKFFSNGIDP